MGIKIHIHTFLIMKSFPNCINLLLKNKMKSLVKDMEEQKGMRSSGEKK